MSEHHTEKKELLLEEEDISDATEDLLDEEPWHKGPLKFIGALFLILMLLIWFIPAYSIKIDPRPSYIPTLSEVVPKGLTSDDTFSNSVTRSLVNGRDPVVKAVADSIAVKSCNSYSKVCHAKAIFYFVRDNFAYVSDPTAYEYVKSAKQSLVVGGGDCDDGSVLTASLLDAVGIRTRFVFIPGHVYIQAYLPEANKKYKSELNWVNLDVTCSYCEFGEIPYKNQDSHKRYL